jgi:hypothetical protein
VTLAFAALGLLLAGAPAAAGGPSPAELRDGLERGLGFLLRAQNADGSWGSARSARTYEVLASVPGSHQAFKAGSTALCVLALAQSPLRAEECRSAAWRGLDFLSGRGRVRRPNGMEMYNIWAFGYTLEAIGRMLPEVEDEARRARLQELARACVAALEVYQMQDGGWGYYDFEVGAYEPADSSMSFSTATVLLGLRAAESAGIAVPARLKELGLKSLRRCRKEDGSYLYGFYARFRPTIGYNQVKGSLGRTLACHLALRHLANEVNDVELGSAVDALLRHHHFMDIGRKRPVPHQAWYYTSGYYYYYGLAHAARALDTLGEGPSSPRRLALARIILERQQKDGSWWDYPLYDYGKAYGTAYALAALRGAWEEKPKSRER